jgi:3'(2'), 5'-bisphosphate nucleotidase
MTIPALDALLLPLCRQAGAAIMEVYDTDFEARSKDDDSPVTEADLAADRIIVAALEKAFPEIAVVTEERASSHEGERPERFFLIDPLDGTKEFVKRGGDFTVNIALIDNGVPVRGYVFAPALDRFFWTDDNGKAMLKEGDEPAREISVATPDNDALRIVASKSHKNPETEEYIGRYKIADYKSAGSSLKFCLVATGEADLYPRLGPTMEWDTGAGDAVLRAAGGFVDRMEGGAVQYGKSDLYNPHFVAYAAGVSLKS